MRAYAPYLEALGGQSGVMEELVARWVEIRSGTYDRAGLARMAEALKDAFAPLGAEAEELDLKPQRVLDSHGHPKDVPLGKALRFRKRPGAPLQVFLGIHYDVVYGDETPSPAVVTVEEADGRRILRGSGAADAKGGIVILLKALEALESSPHAAGLGWEVLLNPDEEIGSPGSLPFLREAAERNHLGLLFEPCLPDGSLVSVRKGSGNFTALMRGRAAHAGRDPHLGRNAVSALAEFVVDLDRFGRSQSGISVNVGRVEGGGPVNRVPDLALARFNLRVRSDSDQAESEAWLRKAVEEFNNRDGISLEIDGAFLSPPKVPAGPGLGLQKMVAACGKELGIGIQWEDSGGVSDGNKLAAAGLPNVDTLGARGGNIHSGEEYLDLGSLPERARLAALLLFKLATGEMPWPPPAHSEKPAPAPAEAKRGSRASRTAASKAAAVAAARAAAQAAAQATAKEEGAASLDTAAGGSGMGGMDGSAGEGGGAAGTGSGERRGAKVPGPEAA